MIGRSLIQLLWSLFLGIGLLSCSPSKQSPVAADKNPDSVEIIRPLNDTLIKLTELLPGDILVKPNTNLLPGSAWVTGGKGFGHALLVIEGGQDSSTMNLLRKVRIFESHARVVPESYELREAQGFQEGTDFRFANITFGNQNAGFRYRLRIQMTDAQRDSVIQFALRQDPDVSCWRSQKKLKVADDEGKHGMSVQDKNTWYCSLLIWEAFYQVMGIDLDANGGIMVYPNDLIASPYFNNNKQNETKRVRF